MVSFTFTLSAAVLIFVQGIQSYCIYNNFTDGTIFDVSQAFSRAQESKVFHKSMGPDAKECCPFSIGDCSYRKINNDVTLFYFHFHWPHYSNERYTVQCTSGGGLAIYGTEIDHWAECTDAFGNTHRVDLFPDAVID